MKRVMKKVINFLKYAKQMAEQISGDDSSVKRGINKSIRVMLLSCAVVLLAATVFQVIGIFRGWAFGTSCEYSTWLENYRGYIGTVNTILAAVVVFFYTVMDNCREGIPHRVIIAYSFGSLSIPCLFFTTLLITILLYYFSALSWKILETVCLMVLTLLQLSIIGIVMASTSFSVSVRVICTAGRRQYEQIKGHKVGVYDNSRMMNFFETALVSEELIVDKIELFSELLRVPVYDRKLIHCGESQRIDYTRLDTDQMTALYKYYYSDLLSAFQSARDFNSENRNKIYSAIYEFLEEFICEMKSDKASKGAKMCKRKDNFLMTASAIMNAVMASGMQDAGSFCAYVFDLVPHECQYTLKMLCVLFQEFLYRISVETAAIVVPPLKNKPGEWLSETDMAYAIAFWRIWTSETSLADDKAVLFFRSVVSTFEGWEYDSPVITYVLKQWEKGTV